MCWWTSASDRAARGRLLAPQAPAGSIGQCAAGPRWTHRSPAQALQGGPRSAARLCLVLGPTPGKENKPLPTLRGRGSKESRPWLDLELLPTRLRLQCVRINGPPSPPGSAAALTRELLVFSSSSPSLWVGWAAQAPRTCGGGERRQPILACFAPFYASTGDHSLVCPGDSLSEQVSTRKEGVPTPWTPCLVRPPTLPSGGPGCSSKHSLPSLRAQGEQGPPSCGFRSPGFPGEARVSQDQVGWAWKERWSRSGEARKASSGRSVVGRGGQPTMARVGTVPRPSRVGPSGGEGLGWSAEGSVWGVVHWGLCSHPVPC